ncbi:GNAT family N-acetyltransferase [Dyella sp.]|uniref:GNAT family N-acetyltransferase n=1 Tax=Dyella sp. TaxID=1869338 RepID=UPI002D78031E|nr:GNAT family N-acetyltransferase [Dyella sp.]HET7329266.1 GNAT family N-acetyltransferase [Dyella sp.]
MTKAPLLRKARVEDAAEVARLAGELSYATSVETMHERLTVLTAHPDHCITVAERDGHMLGWIAVERRRTLESGERVEIVGLVVDAQHRGGGVGRLLVQAAEQWAQQRGFDTLCVRSNVLRDASHPFYERMGYVRRKTQHYYVKTLFHAGEP